MIVEDIAKIDKNLEVQTSLEEKDICFYDTKKAPFDLYGHYKGELDVFKRMPDEVAQKISRGVGSLAHHTAGIRVRFKTDSDYIAIKCAMPIVKPMSHMPLTGSAGFDMFEIIDGAYYYLKTFVPPKDMTNGYESIAYLPDKKMRDIIINFPLYNRVSELYVGVREGSSLDHGNKYKYDKPVLYYGPSTTQGGCASKPSGSYQAIISQRLDSDYINLGFSGSALGEELMADYLSEIESSVFVIDYDGNAPSAEHLRKTHLPIYQKYRSKHPDTPIIIVSSRRIEYPSLDMIEKRNVIMDTYKYALANGDTNVSYVDGYAIYGGYERGYYTVDGVHPNDAGFLRIADVIGYEVQRMLNRFTLLKK